MSKIKHVGQDAPIHDARGFDLNPSVNLQISQSTVGRNFQSSTKLHMGSDKLNL